jgi:phosphotransferase system HPr-like phosphotransfer protein
MRMSVTLISLCLAGTTAHAGVRTVKTIEGVDAGKRVRMEGAVSIRGSTPFTLLVLVTTEGEEVTVASQSPDIEQALKHLDGMRVGVEGEVLAPMGPTLPRLRVERYEILAPSGAGEPIIGLATLEKGACVLTTDDGTRYWITGDLAPALCEHVGARLWMVGKKAKRADGSRPAGSTAFTPTGYGVIGN